MPDKRVGIAVEATADDSGFGEMRSAIDNFSRGGIQAVEKLEDSVIGLQTANVKLRKEIEAVKKAQSDLTKEIDKAGFATLDQGKALKLLADRERQLADAQRTTASQYRTSRMELANLNARQREANENASLLAAQFGIQLPQAVGKFLTRMPAVQSALGAAFNGALIGSFVAAVIVGLDQAYQAYVQFRQRVAVGGSVLEILTGSRAGAIEDTQAAANARADAMREQIRAAQRQGALAPLGGAARVRRELQFRIEDIRREGARSLPVDAAIGAATGAADAQIAVLRREAADQARQLANQTALLGLSAVNAVMVAAQQQIRELQIRAARGEIVDAGAIAAIRQGAATQVQQLQRDLSLQAEAAERAASSTGLSPAGRIAAGAASDIDAFFRQVSSGTAFDDEGRATFDRFQRARQEQAARELAELRRTHEEQITRIVEDAEIARTNVHLRGLKSIEIEERRRFRELEELYRDGLIGEQQFADARVAIEIQMNERRKDAVRDFGRTLESLYDRTVGSAKTFGEAMKNIWREVMAYYKRQAFDALGGILLGQGGGSAGSGGGGLGGVLGGIFGVPGAGGGASTGGFGGFGTPPFIPSNFAAGAGGTIALGSTSGIGGGIGGPAMGQGGLGAIIPSGGILGRLGGRLGRFFNQPGPLGMSVGQALSLSAMIGGLGRGRVGGAITGALGGALGGLTLGMKIGMIGGPLGAVLGAAIGGLIGFLGGGNGQGKRDASAIADQGFAQMRQIQADYEAYRRDFASAMDAIGSVWSGMVGQWSGMGSVGANSIKDQTRYYDQIVTHMRQVEDERNRRRSVIGGLPTPSFAAGGYSMSGGTALLHPGEFVMPARLVERLGLSLLQGLQAGGSTNAGGGGLTMEVLGAANDLFTRDPRALEEGLLVVIRRGGSFSKAMRA